MDQAMIDEIKQRDDETRELLVENDALRAALTDAERILAQLADAGYPVSIELRQARAALVRTGR